MVQTNRLEVPEWTGSTLTVGAFTQYAERGLPGVGGGSAPRPRAARMNLPHIPPCQSAVKSV